MFKFILFILICSGITNSVTSNNFFDFLRNTKSKFINKLFNCSLCLGWWTGIVVYYILDFYNEFTIDCHLYRLTSVWYADMILYGFIASYTCYLLCNLANYYERKH